jgi:hypothetical protein
VHHLSIVSRQYAVLKLKRFLIACNNNQDYYRYRYIVQPREFLLSSNLVDTTYLWHILKIRLTTVQHKQATCLRYVDDSFVV